MNAKNVILLAIVVIVVVIGSIAAYIYLSQPSNTSTPETLNGAGATFPYRVCESIVYIVTGEKVTLR